MLDYTIEFLGAAGVREIFVYCCAHSEKISEHLEKRWSGKAAVGRGVSVKCITASVSVVDSVGDAMRDLFDRKHLGVKYRDNGRFYPGEWGRAK